MTMNVQELFVINMLFVPTRLVPSDASVMRASRVMEYYPAKVNDCYS
jgi:hypothetical protein